MCIGEMIFGSQRPKIISCQRSCWAMRHCNLRFLFMSICATSFFALVRGYLVPFSFFTTWHSVCLNIINYDIFTFSLIRSTKTLAGLKAGIFCAGIEMVTFFDMFLPFFSARVFIIKLPKPRR